MISLPALLVPDTESVPSQLVSTRSIVAGLSVFKTNDKEEIWGHFLMQTEMVACRLEIGFHVLRTSLVRIITDLKRCSRCSVQYAMLSREFITSHIVMG